VKRKRFTAAEISTILAEVDQGKGLVKTCKKFGISPTTYYRWRDEREESSSKVGLFLKYQELAQECACLKQMYAELALRHQRLSEALRSRK
jgi:transposase-like protein